MAGCGGEASHIPPLWQLPAGAVASVVENSIYDVRRNRVKSYLRANEVSVLHEVVSGGGTHLDAAMDLADVGLQRRKALLDDLGGNPGIYLDAENNGRLNIEAVTVAVMVYGN